MAKKKKEMSVRQEAGLVEKDYERLPNDETVEAGEQTDHEANELVGGVIMPEPSAMASPYMGWEEQGMELKTEIVGPPSYGSPDPTTSAGKLLPLRDHPLRADALPEGHPAAVSDDYGADHEGATVMPGESSSSVIPKTDLENDLEGRRNAREGNYEEMKKDELLDEAEARGMNLSASMKKDEIIEALENDDANSSSDDE
jgi:hypothetical protein